MNQTSPPTEQPTRGRTNPLGPLDNLEDYVMHDSTTNPSVNLHVAIDWSSLGYKVFPCRADNKRPHIKKWQDLASADPEQINQWWDRWPEAMPGLHVGSAGFLVLDVDVSKGKNGPETLKALETKHGPLPSTWLAKTPSGGYHYYFRAPQGVELKNTVSKLGRGLDTRAGNGFVILPGSVGESGAYEWVSTGAELAPAPDWIIDKVRKDEEPATPAVEYKPGQEPGNDEFARQALAEAVKAVSEAEGGERNDTLNAKAVRVFGMAKANRLDRAEVHAQLEEAAIAAGLEADETAGTLASAWKGAKPRTEGLRPSPEEMFDAVAEPEFVYVGEMHKVYHWPSGRFWPLEGFYSVLKLRTKEKKDDARESLPHVATIDFAPGEPRVFRDGKLPVLNTWRGLEVQGSDADPGPWLEHLHRLVGNQDEAEHLLNWMAFTIQRPGVKINHGVLMMGEPGNGKDTLFQPLRRALGTAAADVKGEDMLRDFNQYLVGAKLLVIQEANLGNRKDASNISNQLKDLFSAPPETLSVNIKHVAPFNVRNLCSVVVLSNMEVPLMVERGDRRIFAIRTAFRVRDNDGRLFDWTPDYFSQLWHWLEEEGGNAAVVGYLLHRDVTGFNPKAQPPTTEYHDELRESSVEPLERLALEWAKEQVQGATVSPKDAYEELHQRPMLLRECGLKELPALNIVSRKFAAAGVIEAVKVRQGDSVVRAWRILHGGKSAIDYSFLD
ncbi:MAG TPA: hypothetical protein ENI96_09955 [Sedimenticola thiotaurini]|uniref:DNA primase/polymerase bifunctional N-terminal domain-containing protein n=1 Tax=Sedimenticola thiotaurini TaxID=1543721 RepID=A0A831RML3_9GAMM|nr:hypothetical protein [Sedimenticola thiotaurini]